MTSSKRKTFGITIKGDVHTGGGDIAGGDISKTYISSTYSNHSRVEQLFLPVYEQIDRSIALTPKKRQDLKDTVLEIQSEVLKGSEANTTFLQRRLKNISKMAPDILEVVLAVIANPIVGFKMIADKISKQAKDQGQS